MGKKDIKGREYLADPDRFANLLNALIFKGEQAVRAEDVYEADSRAGGRTRDLIRKIAFGTEFVIIGEESQETVDYSLPIRIMESDISNYKTQVNMVKKTTDAMIKAKTGEESVLTPGERMYRYPRVTRIYPVVTIVLSNAEIWDGPKSLRDMLTFKDIPDNLMDLVSDYKLNIIEIPKLSDDEVAGFRTENREVFDFLRCLGDEDKIRRLMAERGDLYERISDEAADFIGLYVDLGKYGIRKGDRGGYVDMRNGLDAIAERHEEIGMEKALGGLLWRRLIMERLARQ